ncbi:MAG: hypothetical protein IPO85_18685 [Saprospiraceae bacterium]|uniref:Uncharacterized protein n=1 Tax=Candidatus Defluviibacterium haderslevense TaxID=2981993 RepID=A0A9D7XG08_9BACT|nr:hypothetical protein [Candidatus Defluviibacterium haderslevense]
MEKVLTAIIDVSSGKALIEAIKEESLEKSAILKPSVLFSEVAKRGNSNDKMKFFV